VRVVAINYILLQDSGLDSCLSPTWETSTELTGWYAEKQKIKRMKSLAGDELGRLEGKGRRED